MPSSRAWAPATFRFLTERVALKRSSFSRTGFVRLCGEDSSSCYCNAQRLPVVGERLVVDGVDAVRVTFRWRRRDAGDCYVILNTITDRSREELDAFRMSTTPESSEVLTLACALPADALVSYQFVSVKASGSDSCVRANMAQWIRFLEDACPDEWNPLTLVNGRGQVASLFVGPDAHVVWPLEATLLSNMPARREEQIGARVSARLAVPRDGGVVVHDGGTRPTRTLILFDGQMWRSNGVGWLTHRYPGLRLVTIDAGDVASRQAELTDEERVGALLRAVCDEVGEGPVMAAGQSYGGLAVLNAALRGDVPLDCVVSQSPSLWWGGRERGRGEGTLMAGLRAATLSPRTDVAVRLQVGTFEQAMCPIVEDCGSLLRSHGVSVAVDEYRGGHDMAWWREGLVRALDDWCALT